MSGGVPVGGLPRAEPDVRVEFAGVGSGDQPGLHLAEEPAARRVR